MQVDSSKNAWLRAGSLMSLSSVVERVDDVRPRVVQVLHQRLGLHLKGLWVIGQRLHCRLRLHERLLSLGDAVVQRRRGNVAPRLVFGAPASLSWPTSLPGPDDRGRDELENVSRSSGTVVVHATRGSDEVGGGAAFRLCPHAVRLVQIV